MDILSLVHKTGHLGDSAICKGFSEQALGGIPLSLRQATRINLLNFHVMYMYSALVSYPGIQSKLWV